VYYDFFVFCVLTLWVGYWQGWSSNCDNFFKTFGNWPHMWCPQQNRWLSQSQQKEREFYDSYDKITCIQIFRNVLCIGIRGRGQEAALVFHWKMERIHSLQLESSYFICHDPSFCWFAQKEPQSPPPDTFYWLLIYLNCNCGRALPRTPLGELTPLPQVP